MKTSASMSGRAVQGTEVPPGFSEISVFPERQMRARQRIAQPFPLVPPVVPVIPAPPAGAQTPSRWHGGRKGKTRRKRKIRRKRKTRRKTRKKKTRKKIRKRIR